jgi:hypothetical protein
MAAGGRCLAGGRHGARIEYLQKGKGRKSEVAFPPVPSRPVPWKKLNPGTNQKRGVTIHSCSQMR